MIHKHNSQEHERIMDAASHIRGAVDALYKEFHNGNEKLNNHIKVLSKYSDLLIDRLESHVQNTEDLDSVWRNYTFVVSFGKWALGIGTALVVGYLLHEIK